MLFYQRSKKYVDKHYSRFDKVLKTEYYTTVIDSLKIAKSRGKITTLRKGVLYHICRRVGLLTRF